MSRKGWRIRIGERFTILIEPYAVSAPLSNTAYSNTYMEQQTPSLQNWRKVRAEELVHTVRRAGPDLWTVKSSTNVGTYRIDNSDGGWKCNCPDHITRLLDCKHIIAVRLHLERLEAADSDEKPESSFHAPTVMNNDVRDWSKYNRAQTEEWEVFGELLRDLTDGLVDPPQSNGRPRMPLSTRCFAAILKVYSQQSARRSQGLYQRAVEANQMEQAPHWNTASKFLNTEEATTILRELIRESALPLASLETHLSVDASGFRCSTYSQWCENKHGAYGKRKQVDWVKCHMISGRLTNIVADVVMTANKGKGSGDVSNFKTLLEGASEGFDILEVSADKAYSSKAILQQVADLGAYPYIPFRSNAVAKPGRSGGRPMWKKAFRFFHLHQEEFYAAYHKRNNVEATFACIKRKFGENVRSKSPVAQKNEVLAKVLAYNITVLIRVMHEFGVPVDFLRPVRMNLDA